jgi:hypothetical protein
VESLEDCGHEGLLAKINAMIVVAVENCRAGLWFVISWTYLHGRG